MSDSEFPKKRKQKNYRTAEEQRLMYDFQKTLKSSSGDKARSRFKKSYIKLKKIVGTDANDFSSERASLALLRSHMIMIVGMMPLLEEKFHKTGRGVYEINNLAQISIEIANILQNMGDKSEQAQSIMENVFDPTLGLILQNLNLQLETVRKQMAVNLPKVVTRRKLRKSLREALGVQASFIQGARQDLQERLIKALKV